MKLSEIKLRCPNCGHIDEIYQWDVESSIGMCDCPKCHSGDFDMAEVVLVLPDPMF